MYQALIRQFYFRTSCVFCIKCVWTWTYVGSNL